MPKTLIHQIPVVKKPKPTEPYIDIAEMFSDTIQGEGVYAGMISTFLRVQGCTLECVWCDTLEVWRYGNPYTFNEIYAIWESAGMIEKFRNGQSLILTGGSPLKQQNMLTLLIQGFVAKYGFKPHIQVENEGVLMPTPEFTALVDVWNNSPKLANSQMKERARLKPDVIKYLSSLKDSWFKFVITGPLDWDEIVHDYLPLIRKNQIILMPEGVTQEELAVNREMVADLAIEHGVRYSDRMHIIIWNLKTGV